MRKLYRSNRDNYIGGVCGGLGEYLNIDSTIVRLVAVIALMAGVGLIPYLILWIIMKEES
jgi:phage shock protein C